MWLWCDVLPFGVKATASPKASGMGVHHQKNVALWWPIANCVNVHEARHFAAISTEGVESAGKIRPTAQPAIDEIDDGWYAVKPPGSQSHDAPSATTIGQWRLELHSLLLIISWWLQSWKHHKTYSFDMFSPEIHIMASWRLKKSVVKSTCSAGCGQILLVDGPWWPQDWCAHGARAVVVMKGASPSNTRRASSGVSRWHLSHFVCQCLPSFPAVEVADSWL